MSVPWIAVNAKVKGGIQLINSINTSKFALLLQHVVQSKNENIFTSEELSKLEETLELNPNNLQILVHTLLYVFKQSSKIILKPTVLQKQLVEDLKFDSDKAEEFVKIWTIVTKNDFENLENRQKLNDMSWEFNLQTASSFRGTEITPHTRIKFELSNVDGSNSENIVLQLDEDELLQMYNTLESVQNKLDFIRNSNESH